MIPAIERLLVPDTAGDPMGGLKWTRRTTEKVSEELKFGGIAASPRTVARLLTDLGYSLRANHKKLAARGSHPERNHQFENIANIRHVFESQHAPVVSVDSKKKELIGPFKNAGAVWAKTPTPVNDHDFRSDAAGLATPYGVFDPQAKRGHVFVGTSHDTPAFAVDALVRWWTHDGRSRYAGAESILILADGGGSNGSRLHAWKYELQTKLCDPFGLDVTVCHYPPGTSKWNPIEHRLFSEVSKNWAGKPLDSYQTMLNYIRTTRTKTGLVVGATLVEGDFPTGIKVPAKEMATLNLRRHDVLPAWNYTIAPRA